MSALDPDWKAIIVKEKEQWLAVIPYIEHKKWTWKIAAQPAFTQHWGICFASRTFDNHYDALGWKKALTLPIIEALNHLDLFVHHCSPAYDYPLPFHWAGYTLKTRYTYWLNLLAGEKIIYAGMASSLKRKIRQTQKIPLQIVESTDTRILSDLYKANAQSGHDIMGKAKASYETLKRLLDYLQKENWARLRLAQDSNGEVHAAAVFGRYKEKSIYLLGAIAPEHRSSGAMSLLMWESIRLSISEGRSVFDFEGSMMEPIEHFFRKFGARPVPYLQLHKNALPLLVEWIRAYMS